MSDTSSSDRHDSAAPGGGSPARRPAWIVGAVLILAGIVFIISNLTGHSIGNWWALFILIPAVGSLWTAGTMFARGNRHFTAASRGPLIGGLVLLVVTAVLLFNMDWGRVWPVFLIVIGAGSLLSAL